MKNADMPAMPLNDYTMQETVQIEGADEGVTTTQYVAASGLTKREHFAALAMKGFISAGCNGMPTADAVASYSIEYADQLLAALENQDD